MTKLCSTKRAAGSVFYPAMTLVGNRSEHRAPLQSTGKQKLIQKHSQKMGRGSVFWSARSLGGQALVRRTERLQPRPALYSVKGPLLPRSNASEARRKGGALCRPSGVGSRVNRGVNDPPLARAV
jgi:hypothetical protein